ncbi:phage tail tube protein [Microvirga yunnanensis]|uniref:phage tail tube protein n=1 Tax=Microvirga yunnanensis TaxID=2953740 RepID=UPI0021C57067|nr:hypothetical protein [Microvirga sp. HBU67655]
MSVFKKPSDRTYSMSRGEGLLKLDGLPDFEHIGDFENLNLKPDQEFLERYSKNFATKTLAKKIQTKRGATMDLTVLQRTSAIKQIIFMGLERSLLQAAVPSTTTAPVTVRKGGIISLGVRDVAVTDVKVGEVVLPVTAYKVDRRTGLVQVYDGGENVTVTYTAKAITEADGRKKIGGFSVEGLRGHFIFRGLDSVNDEPLLVNAWVAEFAVSGDTPLVGGDDLDQLQITATLYPDTTQPEEDQLFTVEAILDGDPA